jgi:hypothetical protein
MNQRTMALIASLFIQPVYAQNVDLIRHVIVNHSAMSVHYELVSIDNTFCTMQGVLNPGQIQAMNCSNSDLSAYGTYILEVEPLGWHGYGMNDSLYYTITQNAQLTWNLAVTTKPRGDVMGITVDEQTF